MTGGTPEVRFCLSGPCLPPSCASLGPPSAILDGIWSILALILGAFWRQFAYFFAPFSHLVPEWRFIHSGRHFGAQMAPTWHPQTLRSKVFAAEGC